MRPIVCNLAELDPWDAWHEMWSRVSRWYYYERLERYRWARLYAQACIREPWWIT